MNLIPLDREAVFSGQTIIQTEEDAEKVVAEHHRDSYDIIKFREVIDFVKHQILTSKGLDNTAYQRLNDARLCENLIFICKMSCPPKAGIR